MGFGYEVLRFGLSGSGFVVSGFTIRDVVGFAFLDFRFRVSRFRVRGSRFRGSGSRVWGFGLGVWCFAVRGVAVRGLDCWNSSSGFPISGSWCRGSGFRVWGLRGA